MLTMTMVGSISACYVPYRTYPALSFEFSPGESISAPPYPSLPETYSPRVGIEAELVFHDDEGALRVPVGGVVHIWELFGQGGLHCEVVCCFVVSDRD